MNSTNCFNIPSTPTMYSRFPEDEDMPRPLRSLPLPKVSALGVPKK